MHHVTHSSNVHSYCMFYDCPYMLHVLPMSVNCTLQRSATVQLSNGYTLSANVHAQSAHVHARFEHSVNVHAHFYTLPPIFSTSAHTQFFWENVYLNHFFCRNFGNLLTFQFPMILKLVERNLGHSTTATLWSPVLNCESNHKEVTSVFGSVASVAQLWYFTCTCWVLQIETVRLSGKFSTMHSSYLSRTKVAFLFYCRSHCLSKYILEG
jgi:hypothetical protein